MRFLVVFTLALIIGGSSGAPFLDWGKKDGNSLLEKVSTIKQTVYEKKRELINGINEKVSKALWIPPWPSSTTEQNVADVPVHHDPVPAETPSIWWWQSTPRADEPTTASPPVTTATMEPRRTLPTRGHPSTTAQPWTSTVPRVDQPTGHDRLVFTVADTNELELPIVSMYARSNLIPKELLLTDSVEYTGPLFVGSPTGPEPNTNRLIVL